MAEMSLERACEVLNERSYLDSQWVIRVGVTGRRTLLGEDGYAGFAMPEHTAIAAAEKLLRDAAPPAERAGGQQDIECIECGSLEVYERQAGDGVHELYCPDCGARFGWSNIAEAMAERAGGRQEGQLSGDSGQLGEAVDRLIAVFESAVDREGVQAVSYTAKGTDETERGWLYPADVRAARQDLRALLAAAEEASRLRQAYLALNHEIEQTLGKALGYPELYPNASKVDDGAVGVGDHTAASLADEAAERITKLQASLAERGPGPATREVMQELAEAIWRDPDEHEIQVELRDVRISAGMIRAALRELNMEPPR